MTPKAGESSASTTNHDLFSSSVWDEEEAALLPLLQAAEDCGKTNNLTTIRSIVMKVLAEPNIFAGYNQIQTVLRQQPAGQQSTTTTNAEPTTPLDKIWNSLDLFSYGTYRDYETSLNSSNNNLYMELTAAQIWKLRQLSVVSVVEAACANGKAHIPYHAFFESAFPVEASSSSSSSSLPPPRRAVEDLLISCLYQGVFHGKLCQKRQLLQINARYPIRPRDVRPNQIPALIQSIRTIQMSIQQATVDDFEAYKQQADMDLQSMASFWQQAEERRRKQESNSHPQSHHHHAAHWVVAGDALDPSSSQAFGMADVGGGSRRQKRGRAAAAAADSAFARFQA